MNRKTFIPYVMRQQADRLCRIMKGLCGRDPCEETRERPVVMARVMVSHVLMVYGYSEHQIGTVLGWDHSTINHYRKKIDDIKRLPGYEAERELLEKFMKKI